MAIELIFQKTDAPRFIHMYYYIKAITNIDAKNQTMHIHFQQYLHWKPTETEYKYFLNDSSYTPDFFPKLQPSNAREILVEEFETKDSSNPLHLLQFKSTDIWGEDIDLNENEILFAVCRKYEINISSPLDFRAFPFDCQSIHLFFESKLKSNLQMLMPCKIKEDCVTIELGTMATDPDFIVQKPVVEFSVFGGDESYASKYACCTLTIKLERISNGFLLRIFFPIFILTLMVLCSFFLELDNSDRQSYVVTLVLALVAFQYVIMDAIPSIPYTTLADMYTIGSLAFTGICLFYISVALDSSFNISYDTDRIIFFIFFIFFIIINIFFTGYAYCVKKRSTDTLALSYSEMWEKDLCKIQSGCIGVKSSETKMLYDKSDLNPTSDELGIEFNKI